MTKKEINVLYDYQALNMQKYGGISRYFYELASGLRKKENVNVDVAAMFSVNHYFENYFPKKKSAGFSGLLGRANNALNRASVLSKSRSKYNIVHPTYYHPYILNKFKSKLVITIHDMIYELFPTEMDCSEVIIANKKAHIFAADKIICVSEWTKRDLLRIYPEIPEEKTAVIYHGNSMKFSSFEVKPVKNLPQKYILFMGQRDKYKNFNRFIRAIAPLILSDEELWLVVGGGGAFSDSERALLFELGIEQRCMRINYSDSELPYVYGNAQCFVYPSLYEGFGIPILEAWACGCPLALSNASCFPEIAGDAGVYFDGTDEESIRKNIARLLIDESLRNEIRIKGKERLKLYSWEKTVEETLKVYEDLLN